MQAPATYTAPARPIWELLIPRPVLSGLRASLIDPTMVTSSPSRIQTVPRPTTMSQCHRAHGSRSIRAGMSVVIRFSSTAPAMWFLPEPEIPLPDLVPPGIRPKPKPPESS